MHAFIKPNTLTLVYTRSFVVASDHIYNISFSLDASLVFVLLWILVRESTIKSSILEVSVEVACHMYGTIPMNSKRLWKHNSDPSFNS